MYVRRSKRSRLNKAQLKATAELFLEISKAITLATVIGLVFPGVGEKVGVAGAILGGMVALIAYVIAMWLLKEVKI